VDIGDLMCAGSQSESFQLSAVSCQLAPADAVFRFQLQKAISCDEAQSGAMKLTADG
jgi:hypothetical protein